MIKAVITNEMLKYITAIDENRFRMADIELPTIEMNRLRKNSKKKAPMLLIKLRGILLQKSRQTKR